MLRPLVNSNRNENTASQKKSERSSFTLSELADRAYTCDRDRRPNLRMYTFTRLIDRLQAERDSQHLS